MSIHQYNEELPPDEEFIPGATAFLVEGNSCRLLDGRRTPGMIEKIFNKSAMFRWRITDFEDKGKYWDVPAEDVVRYQFDRDAGKLDVKRVEEIEAAIKKYQARLVIEVSEENRKQTESEIQQVEKIAKDWLKRKSLFFGNREQLDLKSRAGSESLAEDLLSYMVSIGMEDIERRTAGNIVLNPYSGEWIKGMGMVLAEMGLVPYRDKMPRTRDIFEGLGAKETRRDYLIHRLAFIRAYFRMSEIREVVLYRGMSTERAWKTKPRTFLSCTFSLKVARCFCGFERDCKFKHSYLLKRTFPVEKLFMTYLETKAMNRQYKEAEALVLYNEKDGTF